MEFLYLGNPKPFELIEQIEPFERFYLSLNFLSR